MVIIVSTPSELIFLDLKMYRADTQFFTEKTNSIWIPAWHG